MQAWVTKPIPMKRELKVWRGGSVLAVVIIVTKPIPMKRELKGWATAMHSEAEHSHKANPDEKGTERIVCFGWLLIELVGHKANPDEKGTESE